MIEREGKKWVIYSQQDGKKLGTFSSHEAALNAMKGIKEQTKSDAMQMPKVDHDSMMLPDVKNKPKKYKKA